MKSDKTLTKTSPRIWPCLFPALVLGTGLFALTVGVPPLTGLLPASAAAEEGAAGGDAMLLRLVEQMQSSYAQVIDYQAVFHKQERVEGKLLPEETILLKFRKPLQIYMNWIGESRKGTEVLYVKGMNDDKLIAHRGGVLGLVTLALDPKGPMAMKDNRHPITEAGFGFTLEQMKHDLDKAIAHGEFKIIRMCEEAFRGRPATLVEAVFTPREGRKYYASRMVIYVDRELRLPVGNAFYNEKDELFEKYSFTDVKLNIGLTDKDFSKSNKEYRF